MVDLEPPCDAARGGPHVQQLLAEARLVRVSVRGRGRVRVRVRVRVRFRVIGLGLGLGLGVGVGVGVGSGLGLELLAEARVVARLCRQQHAAQL